MSFTMSDLHERIPEEFDNSGDMTANKNNAGDAGYTDRARRDANQEPWTDLSANEATDETPMVPHSGRVEADFPANEATDSTTIIPHSTRVGEVLSKDSMTDSPAEATLAPKVSHTMTTAPAEATLAPEVSPSATDTEAEKWSAEDIRLHDSHASAISGQLGRPTLKVEHLKKIYGKREVVSDISFEMQGGDIIGLLGPNGAGKTTTFYMIVGFIKANGGKIYVNEHSIMGLPMYKRARMGLSYLPQEPSIFRKLSVRDNVKLVAETRRDLTGQQKKELVDRLIESFGLTRLVKQKGYTLSGGERRRTEIARSLATSPSFLLLDEPFAGIDPKAVYEIKQIIRRLASQGIGILITDHNVRDTLAITTCSHLISEGKILVSGTKADLLKNEVARDTYFGDAFEVE